MGKLGLHNEELDNLYWLSNTVWWRNLGGYRGMDMQFTWEEKKCIQNCYGETHWNVTTSCKT